MNHPERVRRNYDLGDPVRAGHSSVLMVAVNSYERDVRTLLDYCEHNYASPEIAAVIRRLRRAVD